MLVRKAATEDAQALAVVVAAVAEEGFLGAEPPVDLEDRARRLRETIEGEGRSAAWALEEGRRVVGMATVGERFQGVLQLGMAIVPDARGRGGGSALLEAIMQYASATGAHKVELEAWTDNARAIAFYAAAGFEVEGIRRDHYRRRDGRLRSSILMARQLSR